MKPGFRENALLLSVLALAACQKPHPAVPVPPPQTPPQTLRADGPSTAQRQAEEAKWLAAFPDVATRDGTTLIIRYNGAEIARYIDDPRGCNPYSVSKVVRLYDETSKALQPVAEITCHFGALDNRYLVLPTSTKYTVRDDVDAAPDGKRLAMADNALGPTGGDFTLVDWPSMTRIAGFKVGCRNVTWADAGHLQALCWHNNGSSPQDADDSRTVFFMADITQGDGDHWTMTATGFVDGASGHPVPTASRALPRFIAEVPAPDRP